MGRSVGADASGHGRRRDALVTAVLLVAVAALSACQSPATPSPASSVTASTSTTPEPTPSESPSAQPAVTPSTSPSASPTDGGTAPGPVNGPNQITSPAPGATVPGPSVTVQGLGTAFEGTLDYRVLVAGTETVITEGFTDSGANGEVGPFSFEVGLQPGTYSVQVWEPDMSDGASGSDPRHNLVQVDFTVS